MKAVPIITQLARELPFYTNLFSRQITITSLERDGNTVTATTASAHNLRAGGSINIVGAIVKNPVVSMSHTIDGLVTVVTENDHDLTEGYNETITLYGSDQPEYNGEHVLDSVPNRRTFQFYVDPDTVTPSTGDAYMLIENYWLTTYNGLKLIDSVPTTTTFTYTIPSGDGLPPLPYSPAYGTSIKGHTGLNIGAFFDYDSAYKAYTEKTTPLTPGKYWLFVELNDTAMSKSRHTEDDAVRTTMSGYEYRDRLITQFSVYVFAPLPNWSTAQTVSGLDVRDSMEDVMAALLKSIGRMTLPSPFFEEPWSELMLVGAGMHAYDNEVYVHRFVFETTQEVVYEDTMREPPTVSFKDLYFDFKSLETGDVISHAYVNLDDVPLG